MGERHHQRQFAVRMEWGLQGAEMISQQADYAVIVDVLSFCTTVSVAVDQGAEVYPYPWRDESAHEYARQHRAVVAVGRSDARGATGAATADHRVVSLSPASVRAAVGVDRIVLPSPNGSALAAALVRSGVPIVAACLRNRTAVASWLAAQPGASDRPARPGTPGPGRVIAVIAAGERWPDGTLRPAVEDLWGAGAVIAAVERLGITALSPEARSAAAAWHAIEATLDLALASCSSGTELADAGFSADVAIAGEVDASGCVPLLSVDRFADALAPQARPTAQDRSTAQARSKARAGQTAKARSTAQAEPPAQGDGAGSPAGPGT
jgi:2-phosphosulfolactate phosphatase